MKIPVVIYSGNGNPYNIFPSAMFTMAGIYFDYLLIRKNS